MHRNFFPTIGLKKKRGEGVETFHRWFFHGIISSVPETRNYGDEELFQVLIGCKNVFFVPTRIWSKDNNSFSQGCRTLPGPDVIPNFKLGGELARRSLETQDVTDGTRQKSPQFRLRARRKFRQQTPSPPLPPLPSSPPARPPHPLYGLTFQLCHYSDCLALSSLAVDAPRHQLSFTVIYRVSCCYRSNNNTLRARRGSVTRLSTRFSSRATIHF